MRKVAAFSVILVLVLSGSALAMGKTHEATISMVHNDQNMMMVKDKSGKEWSIYWNDSTKVEGGAPKEGAMVWFTATEKDGKMWASWVKTEAAKGKM